MYHATKRSGRRNLSRYWSLEKNVEQLREQLVQLYLEKNNLLDDEVVDLSQQLDKYILAIQLKMMKKE